VYRGGDGGHGFCAPAARPQTHEDSASDAVAFAGVIAQGQGCAVEKVPAVSPSPGEGGQIEDIERQIDNTRAALDHTIRALRVELSPRHRAQVAWRSAKARTVRSMHYSADWAVANPVPIAIGAIVLVAAAFVMSDRRWRR
jgi:hypothetical protein